MSDRLCVVMPVYNEQDAIGPVLEKWDTALKDLDIDYEIRPYNDGSKDDSLKVMHEVSQRLGERINVRDKKNGGHGNTILTGYREAASDGFDWVFQIDSDDEMGPEKFNELWSRRNDYDFLVGIRDGRVQALPRKIISFVSRLCVRIFYGKSIWDVNTPYRLMRVSAFKPFYEAIPMTTFAPNVILSGLAARHKLRCFETRVPQHDRTTGEVSIKKWKLLKAAARSFIQTIWFSFESRNVLWPCVGMNLFFWILTVAAINFTTIPWVDECGTVDTAANIVVHGVWDSHVWHYSYNPLHINLLVWWLRLFGVSHLSVCAFSATLGLVLCLVLRWILREQGVLRGIKLEILYSVLFWCGWRFSWILVNGRIDTLVAIFTVLTANELYDTRKTSSFRLFIFALLLMLAGVYSVPLVVFFGAVLLLLRKGHDKIALLKKGIICALGIILAFIISCGYYAYHNQLFRFIHTFFSYNETLSGRVEVDNINKMLECYMYDVEGLLIYTVSVIAVLFQGRKLSRAWLYVLLIGVVPLIQKFAGRYEIYYSWLFYIPTVVLFLWVVTRCARVFHVYIILAVCLCFGAVSFLVRYRSTDISNQMYSKIDAHIQANASSLTHGASAVINSYAYYYPLIQRGVWVWNVGDNCSQPINGPRDKFQKFLHHKIDSESIREWLLKLYDRYEREYNDSEMPSSIVDLRICRQS